MIQIPNSKELKARFANKQIKLDGEPISIEQFKELNLDKAEPLPDFLCKNADMFTINLCQWLGVEADDMATTNIKSLTKLFEDKKILRMSKKEIFVI